MITKSNKTKIWLNGYMAKWLYNQQFNNRTIEQFEHTSTIGGDKICLVY